MRIFIIRGASFHPDANFAPEDLALPVVPSSVSFSSPKRTGRAESVIVDDLGPARPDVAQIDEPQIRKGRR